MLTLSRFIKHIDIAIKEKLRKFQLSTIIIKKQLLLLRKVKFSYRLCFQVQLKQLHLQVLLLIYHILSQYLIQAWLKINEIGLS
jgi:hypothetical protein